ncbi:capsular biosynthesis protein [Pseudoalteromonas sp. HL-AS1]|uniref:capsular biosynthesis protein n=1 Tax=Pseudoalteromonas sp. HL-AS1 TaxID=3071081 RepID=UPI0028151224|nr:capsular biosynthesis protein [Pseudoalteromonas sp. HL-AS1]WMS91297.1 capsular biosynthesis protein [Pseudoalteromonas sp. HL-AS1]
MFLIMSGAYIGQELQSEFGRIPPSFLPLGNRRLFLHQLKLAPKGVRTYLTVPESYKVSRTDLELLKTNEVEVLPLPDNLTLGESLITALNLSEHTFNEPLHVLFGDTLFKKLPQGDNFASLSTVEENYHWAVATENDNDWLQLAQGQLDINGSQIINGYFKFSQPRELLRAITKSNWNFLAGLNYYKTHTDFSSSLAKDWLDFGHVNTYYSSKANFTTQRAFNDLKITPNWIEKSSSKDIKIAAESNWFATLPFSLRNYIPQYLGERNHEGRTSYRLEYLHNTALNELYVFSELPQKVWKRILTECVGFLKACSQEKAPEEAATNTLPELFGTKTDQRLTEFCSTRGYDQDKVWIYADVSASLNDVLSLSSKNLPSDNHNSSVLHGDFCFSNILYDFRANRIKTIDPRGLTTDSELSIYGHVYYDIAKLAHSIIGLYDWIIAGYYTVDLKNTVIELSIDTNNKQQNIQAFFIQLIEQEFSISQKQVIAMQIQLFLSMLPLHSDDTKRQDALFANAFRLHKKLKELE